MDSTEKTSEEVIVYCAYAWQELIGNYRTFEPEFQQVNVIEIRGLLDKL